MLGTHSTTEQHPALLLPSALLSKREKDAESWPILKPVLIRLWKGYVFNLGLPVMVWGTA